MAQGLGIQVLLRAWQASGDAAYLEAAGMARNAFEVSVAEGGVTLKDQADAWWFEEYASVGALESRVFNGAAHSVIGLHEMATRADDERARLLYEKGIASLAASLPTYDAGWWTYYDALGLMANYKYHEVNIGLARKIGEISDDDRFSAAAATWSAYRTPFFIREFVRQRPQYHDIVVLGLSGVIAFVVLLGPITLLLRVRRSSLGVQS
jgi:heparosan-N-sulfate-glucuronate 5-epimerase